MANSEYREPHQQAREVGLAKRHETRQERAIRRQVAEEIALAIEAFMDESAKAPMAVQLAIGSGHNYLLRAVEITREIGSRGGTDATGA